MSNFQSYSSYVPHPEETFSASPTIREEAPVHRVGMSNGVLSTSTESSSDKGHSGQINPHSGTDSWQATARTATGRAVTEITADDLVTINGMQAKVSFWVSEGVLQKGTDGQFTEGTGTPPEAPSQDSQVDHFPIDDGAMSVLNAALAPLPDYALDNITAHAIGAAIGRVTDQTLVSKFSQVSGLDPAESQERMTTMSAIYQDQADKALSTRYSIGADDKIAFWDWAKTNHQGQLQEAVGKQLRQHDVSGYKALADRWLNETAPSINALKAGGIPVRNQGTGPQCFVAGTWMTPSAAARAGLV